MKLLICVLAALVLCGSISAQQHSMHSQPAAKESHADERAWETCTILFQPAILRRRNFLTRECA